MVRSLEIRDACPGDEHQLAEMRTLLWSSTTLSEQLEEVQAYLAGKIPGTLPCITFVAEKDQGALAGFIEVDLRSHADGCDPNLPVGYIEGWFVRELFRGRGIGKALVKAAEDWARALGSREMASDALIDNAVSFDAHTALGFEVVDRCVHFRKDL
jgi:aminoglycoside 6'-N-acetyltransferase I